LQEYMIQDAEPRLYLYKQKMGEHEQVGIIGAAAVEEYEKDIIKKHEYTLKKKEDDRTRHVDITNVNAGPVFLTYRAQPEIDAIVNRIIGEDEPIYDFTPAEDDIRHTLWLVEKAEDLQALSTLFQEKVPTLYVADGHHRSASAARVGKIRREANPNHQGDEEYNFFLAVFFPDNQLHILDYNRVIVDLNGHTPEQLKEKLNTIFEISEAADGNPEKRHTFGMYLQGQWYRLTAKPDIINEDDVVKCLDVSILQENVLTPIFDIHDPKKDNRINFVGGIRGTNELKKLVDAGKYQIAFSMFPTSMDELLAVADAGKIMPPKSTWFEPKLRSGLVVHTLD